MPQNDNSHSLRMIDSIKNNIGEDAANDFAARLPLSKAADIQKKYEWAKAACEYLDERYDEETRKQIRFQCNCGDGNTTAIKMIKYISKTGNMREFVDMFNAKETFASMELNGENLLFCYPECYCGCVKRIDKNLSKTWCYCTLGYAKAMFDKVFHKSVEVELLESIKTGGNRCVIKVIL